MAHPLPTRRCHFVLNLNFKEGFMSGGVYSKKLILSYFFIGLFCLLNLLLNYACTNNNDPIKFEDREGILFIKGQDKLFSGKVVDTVGKRILEYEVVNGKKNGIFKISLVKGSVAMVGLIKDNLNEGEWSYYYPNGHLESRGNFKNNLSEGKWTWYFDSGKIREIGYFQAGIKQGDWIIYDEKGNVIRKLFFKDGQITDDKDYNKELFS